MDKFNIRKIEGYTIMSNYHLRDHNLSHAARGLLSFMLSLPDNWDYSFSGLVTISKEGKAAIRTMINQLKIAKYIKISRYRNEKGYFQYNYDVFEIPFDMDLKMYNHPTPDFRTTNHRTSEKQQQINTNKQIDKKDKTNLNNYHLIKELIRTGYINKNDSQIVLYDNLFDNYLNMGKNNIDLYSAIHYIVPKVISHNFTDENDEKIDNKFGYFQAAIESNFKKLEKNITDIYSDEEINNLFDNFNDGR